ncbi:hypothetical protein B0H14DRAFT_2616603 [Mycena olivaceomarginata]|nr:hypothetical protein B0H14DRAFT_2616603 [Mycena olivaceomarginata]
MTRSRGLEAGEVPRARPRGALKAKVLMRPANGKPAPKVPHKRNMPKHLLDGSNSEALSTAHQAIVDAIQARLNPVPLQTSLRNIEDLDAVVPTAVAEGTDKDEIHRVLTTVHSLDKDSPASTFTRRFDILFKEDTQCHDTNGCLHLIRHSELGMLMVVRYRRKIKWSAPNMNLDSAVIKLEWVVG